MGKDTDGENLTVLEEAVSEIPLIGKSLAVAIKERRWRLVTVIVGVVFFLFVYPLVVPLAASALINAGVLAGWQKPYAESVRRAFSIDKAALDVESANNQRLDYFQMIDASSNANEERSYAISVQPYQRMRLRTSGVQLVTQNKTCAVPAQFLKRGVKMFSLEIGGVSLGDIRNDGVDATFEVTKEQWDRMKPRLDGGRLLIALLPVDDLRNIPCDELKANIRMTIEVFKDLLQAV